MNNKNADENVDMLYVHMLWTFIISDKDDSLFVRNHTKNRKEYCNVLKNL